MVPRLSIFRLHVFLFGCGVEFTQPNSGSVREYLVAPSVDGDVEDGLREPLGSGVLVGRVESVVGDGVAEYAELPAF